MSAIAQLRGAVPGMPEAEYRAYPAWSVSQWKILPKKPELFYGFYVAPPEERFEFEETSDLLFGTNCHAEFLEGKPCSQVPPEYLTSNGQRRGKAYEHYAALHGALECLNAKEMAAVGGIRDSLKSQPKLADLIFGEGWTELAVFDHHAETGLDIKARLDKLRKTSGGLILGDFKVTSIDPDDERQVIAKVYEMGYILQLAHYFDMVTAAFGEPPVDAVLVFARNKPPYTVRAWRPSEIDLDLGRRRNRAALLDLRRRLDESDWIGWRHNRINNGPEGSLLPKWAFTDDPDDNPPNFAADFAAFSGEAIDV